MRIFTAILPDEEMRQAFASLQEELQRSGIRGRFTDLYNLHMTLSFIGEYGNPDAVMDVLEEISFEPVCLQMEAIEKWNDLLVCTFRKNDVLENNVRRLRRALAENGIPYDRKNFRPHITLARKTAGEAELPVPDLMMEADTVSLMKSERHRDHMVYTEIGAVHYEWTEPDEAQ